MQWHLRKENEVVLSYRWKFQDGRSKGMGTEWDKEVVGKVPPKPPVSWALSSRGHLGSPAVHVGWARATAMRLL